MDRHRGDRSGDGGRHSRTPSRWSSGSPTHGNPRYPRGVGGGAGGGGAGGGESLSGGGAGSGGRYHPYRGPPDYAGGFRAGGGGSPGGFSGPPLPGPGLGPRRGFAAGGGSPDADRDNRNNYVKLFIGSVPRTSTEEEIRPVFEEHGDVVEVALIKDRRTGEPQGCCFIKYATSEDAERAIRALHNQYTLPGGTGPIQVRYADGERERHGAVEHKLFVAQLNKQADTMEIEEIFAPYGHVEDVYIMRDAMRQSRGCGFVKFSTREMAAAAMTALNGTYVMRGCDLPLIVRFADPKRPRPGESRGGPAFGGPGFSPRSEAAFIIRPTANLDESKDRHMPPDSWHLSSLQTMGPSQFTNPGSDSHSNAKGGAVTTSADTVGVFGPAMFPANGSLSSHATAQSSLLHLGINPALAQVRPIIGQQIAPLQKPQNFPPLQLHNTQIPTSLSQTQNMQAPMQLGQLQIPQSIGLSSFGQALPSLQVPGIGGHMSASQPLIQQNPSPGALQIPLTTQHATQPFPASNVAPQLLQQPIQQLPSQIPQLVLQQQAQALQSSFQSSQQTILQLQQQLQLMQQQSNLNQQQAAQAAKQQLAMIGPPVTSGTSAGAPAAVMPTGTSFPVTTPAIPLTCDWTEHTSPEGFKYYYNSITRESKWEKPEEFALFEQQQKLLLLHQQQQKLPVQHLQSLPQAQSFTQMQPAQQATQTLQGQSQMQMKQQALYQASAVAGQQNLQDLSYPQLQAATSVVDVSRIQQGIQAAQEWAWKNKPAG